jgi:hypothetical protein
MVNHCSQVVGGGGKFWDYTNRGVCPEPLPKPHCRSDRCTSPSAGPHPHLLAAPHAMPHNYAMHYCWSRAGSHEIPSKQASTHACMEASASGQAHARHAPAAAAPGAAVPRPWRRSPPKPRAPRPPGPANRRTRPAAGRTPVPGPTQLPWTAHERGGWPACTRRASRRPAGLLSASPGSLALAGAARLDDTPLGASRGTPGGRGAVWRGAERISLPVCACILSCNQ